MAGEEAPAFDPGEYTVPEVEDYVEANPDERQAVLDAELAGKQRSTLIGWLESGVETETEAEAETEDDVEINLQATTTKTKDFVGRLLTNPTPGTSQATDFLGRGVLAGDKDFIGRALVP